MCTEPHRWHYDYTRIAWDTGFCFDSYKTQKVFDRNGIALLDIERIIRERDIAIVDHHIQSILEYKLDIEETRILDPNFVKLFRLSQLAVEYLTYCKKYLDSTITIIKQDLQKANEENAELKHELVNYQSEIHKWKKKVKDLKSTLLVHEKYQQPKVISVADGVPTFQCNACAKVFINDEYLKAHVTRRHSSNEEPVKIIQQEDNTPVSSQYKTETDRLQMEIKELKEKLNSRERYFKNEEENMKISGAGGTVQSEEYYKRMEKLHEEFELFKTQYEAEMKLIRKGEQDKYDKWMEKIFTKLDTNTAKIQNVKDEEIPVKNINESTNKIERIVEDNVDGSKYKKEEQIEEKSTNKIVENTKDNVDGLRSKKEVQIDEKMTVEEDISSEAGEIQFPPKQETIHEELTIKDTKTVQKELDNIVADISKVKEEVGKELEEKTKQDIEKLGEQLSEQMSDTFGKLQTRMETFWHKLQEIDLRRDKEHMLLVTHAQQTPPTPKLRTELVQNTSQHVIESRDNSSTQNSTSEESETESNCFETVEAPKQPRPSMISNKITGAVISELKTKIVEQKATKTQQQATKPNVQKIFSKPLIKKPTESDSESESESTGTDSEESESEPVIVQQAEKIQPSTKIEQNRTQNTSVKSTERPKAEVLQQFRNLVEDEFIERQRDLGLDPEWIRLPDKSFKQKLDILAHQRMLEAQDIPSLNDIRDNIIQKLDIKLNETNRSSSPSPEPEIAKPSRFKSLFRNMKNKAKSMIRHDRSPSANTSTTGIYKLTIVRDDSPEPEEQNVPKPTPRTRINKSPRTNNKMYETESENQSESIAEKRIKTDRKALRKTKSETNMSAPKETSPMNANLVRSLSNLDSILEIKKELSNIQDSEASSEDIHEVIAVSPREKTSVVNNENEKCKLENISSDLDSDDIKEEKAHKSAMKNYPSTVKKKVLFDLHNDEQKIEIDDGRSNEHNIKHVERKLVKSNSLFQTDAVNGNDSSTSIDSDILDFHKTSPSGDTISTKALINVTSKTQDDTSDWDISDIVK